MTGLAELPPLLTVEEARETLLQGLGRNQIYAALQAGELPAIRIGRSWRLCRDPLLRMLGVEPANDDSPGGGTGAVSEAFPDRGDDQGGPGAT